MRSIYSLDVIIEKSTKDIILEQVDPDPTEQLINKIYLTPEQIPLVIRLLRSAIKEIKDEKAH